MRKIFFLFCLALSGCITPQVQEDTDIYDPLEEWNRSVFAFNRMMDLGVVGPVLTIYETIIPGPLRNGIHNVISTGTEPTSMVHSLLQFDWEKFSAHTLRLLVNLTAGIGGLIDVARTIGLSPEQEDLGKTLKTMAGVGPGWYMVLPFLGPSNIRDALSLSIDTFTNPASYSKYALPIYYSLDYIDTSLRYKDTKEETHKNFSDPYAVMRGAYYEHREDLLSGEEAQGEDLVSTAASLEEPSPKEPAGASIIDSALSLELEDAENFDLEEGNEVLLDKQLVVIGNEVVPAGEEEVRLEVEESEDAALFPGIEDVTAFWGE